MIHRKRRRPGALDVIAGGVVPVQLNVDGDLVIVTVDGKVTAEFYLGLRTAIDGIVATGSTPKLLLVIDSLTGTEVGIMRQDAEFVLHQYPKVAKAAIVTDETWLRVAMDIASPFTPTHERTFRREELAEARRWLTTGDE